LDSGTNTCQSCPGNCQNCNSLTECTQCSSANELVEVTVPTPKTDCLPWCLPTEYRKPDGTCAACNIGCKQCVGPTYLECKGSGCQTGYNKIIHNPATPEVFSCPQGCPNGRYLNTGTGQCSVCNTGCFTCDGPTANDCLSCR
jgi:proprotein convertase subtilisin/kexin type 5